MFDNSYLSSWESEGFREFFPREKHSGRTESIYSNIRQERLAGADDEVRTTRPMGRARAATPADEMDKTVHLQLWGSCETVLPRTGAATARDEQGLRPVSYGQQTSAANAPTK